MTRLLPLLHKIFFFVPLLLCFLLSSEVFASPTKFNEVPTWAKDAVWYQIFPERFRNGDKKNDPTVNDIRGSWPQEKPKQWHISTWTGDWYKLQRWEKTDDKGFYYHAQQRRYGGDLQGVIQKLDYLKKLGINAIYFNPLFESPSLHKYDATMYHHIDNNFGPDPEGDRKMWEKENPADPKTWQWTSADRLFLKLLDEAHKRNIRVIIDGVFNHVGITFWAFEDVEKNGEKSKYKDWFTIKAYDNPATAQNEFDYEGWAGVKELPELREDANGLLPPIRDHIHAIVQRWGDPNNDGDPSDGIDGWRLDVADKVAMPFWRDFRRWVRDVNPEAYIVGEVWWEDYDKGKMFNAAPWLGGDAFDAVMNYRVAREVGLFFKAQKNKISAAEFVGRLDEFRKEYRSDVNYVLMNLLDSHDTDRLPSQIVNPDTKFDKNVNVNDNRAYNVRKPNGEEIKTQKLMVLFQMTYLGAPTVYYGDEAGMWGADDPDERKPMLWADMQFEKEASHPFGLKRPVDANVFDSDLFNYYSRLIHMRLSSPALKRGSFTTLATDDKRDLWAYLRSVERDHAIIILNNSKEDQNVQIPLTDDLAGLKWKNVLNQTQISIQQQTLTVHLNGKSGIVLQAKAK